ncbi:sugar kinase [Silvimonas sp. JCM 19000]
MKKVMTAGEILVEIMATERGQSFREPGTLVGPYPSGAPAIFIDQVAHLGVPCAMIGCVGDDDFGWLNIERLKRDGVDVGPIAVDKQAVTGSAFVTYRNNGERDFIFNIANSASGKLNADLFTPETLAGCGHFHVMGSSLFSFRIIDAIKKAIEIVKNNGGTISFDPNVRKEMLRIPEMRDALTFVLEYTDIFLPSGPEVSLLTNERDEAGAINELLGLGIREIVVKRGAQGCSYYDREQHIDMPAFAVEEIDPTGAGDCFGATYISSRMLGLPIDTCLQYACASGAFAVTRRGPMEGVAGFSQLDTLLATRS